jgi:hypothetical protein
LEEAKALFFPGIMSRARYILQMKERIWGLHWSYQFWILDPKTILPPWASSFQTNITKMIVILASNFRVKP